MAQVLYEQDGSWVAGRLSGRRYELHRGPIELRSAATRDTGAASAPHDATLVRGGAPGAGGAWILLLHTHGAVRINGEPVPTGIWALRHRDEIRLDDERCFFSAEREAVVETYRGTDEPRCPRCAVAIQQGEECVRCPAAGCGVLHHQRAGRECWTHTPKCGLCDQRTELGAGWSWSPEDL